jgi:hypothetical protein
MANFAYGAQEQQEQHQPVEEQILEIVLRDTCVLYYRRSYDKVLDGVKGFKEHVREINALVKAALIITD